MLLLRRAEDELFKDKLKSSEYFWLKNQNKTTIIIYLNQKKMYSFPDKTRS